jgi:hypothetical protein
VAERGSRVAAGLGFQSVMTRRTGTERPTFFPSRWYRMVAENWAVIVVIERRDCDGIDHCDDL